MHGAPKLLVAILVLAGCASTEPGSEAGTFEPELDKQLQATATTGIIRGVVVDEAVAPVVGAVVKLVGSERSTVTTASGAFGFANLEPGVYFLVASSSGYSETQVAVTVEAGVDDSPVLRVLMNRDPTSDPFVAGLSFRGFLRCSGSDGSWCGSVDHTFYSLTGQNITGEEFIVYHDIPRPDPWWFQSELVWESTQVLGDRLEVSPAYAKQNAYGSPFADMRVSGTSPVVSGAGNTTLEEAKERENFDPEDWQLVVRAFGAEYCVTPDLCPYGVVVDQEFDMFSHVFYNYLPPEGWRFTESPPPEPGR